MHKKSIQPFENSYYLLIKRKRGNRIPWEAFTVYELFYFFKIKSETTMAKC